MGNDDGYEDHFDDGFDDELDADEAAPKKKKRVATSTKVVLVIAGWLLLTLFLIGEFSENKNPAGDTATAQLDTVDSDGDGETDVEEELVIDEEAALETFDADGDGVLSDTERAAAVEAYEAAVASGEVAIGEPWNGVTGGSAATAEEGTGESAAPGAGPTSGGSGGSGSGTGSGTAGGGSAGGDSTTTTAAGGGGGSSTTSTAKPVGGGNATTTVKPTTTTSPTTAPPPPPPAGTPVTFDVTAAGLAFDSDQDRDITLARRSKIRFDNQEGSSNVSHAFTIDGVWDPDPINKNADPILSPELPAGTYTFYCKVHPALPAMRGSITLT